MHFSLCKYSSSQHLLYLLFYSIPLLLSLKNTLFLYSQYHSLLQKYKKIEYQYTVLYQFYLQNQRKLQSLENKLNQHSIRFYQPISTIEELD